MKKWGIIIMAILTAASLCACRRADTLTCTVLEVYDNAFMALCTGEEGPFPEGGRLYVNCKTMPEIRPGDLLRVAFYEPMMLSEPPQIVAKKVEVIIDRSLDTNCE